MKIEQHHPKGAFPRYPGQLARAAGISRREASRYFKAPHFSMDEATFNATVAKVKAQKLAENAFQIEPANAAKD